MNRVFWQQLAEERVLDAKVLLDAGRWSGAYHLAGYAAECGLKACILAFLEVNLDMIFRERRFSEKCWVHELGILVELAGLNAALAARLAVNPVFAGFWGIAKDWKETSRYEIKTQADAEQLYEAIAHDPDGVLPWYTNGLVTRRIEDGRKFIKMLSVRGFEVTSAWWVRTTEEDVWFLYIASPKVDEKKLATAYSEAYSILQTMEGTTVSASEVKLIGAEHRHSGNPRRSQAIPGYVRGLINLEAGGICDDRGGLRLWASRNTEAGVHGSVRPTGTNESMAGQIRARPDAQRRES